MYLLINSYLSKHLYQFLFFSFSTMKLFLVVAVCFVAANADSVLDKWNEFKLTHGKTYKSPLEERRRLTIFQDNLKIIDQHNEKFDNGISTFKMGITRFTDMTRDEFKSMLGYVSWKKLGVERDTFIPRGVSVNKTINYVHEGYVTDVKDQGMCGSCWAFAVAGMVEGQVAKEKGILKSLSPQNLLNCVEDNNDGCDGGDPTSAMEYIHEYGILSEKEVPYRWAKHECHERGGWKVKKPINIPADPDSALEALATVGPFQMSVDGADLQFYFFGIIDGHGSCKHGEEDLDHAVLAVGAGTQGNTDYFLVKNSWGFLWGSGGYFKIKRTANTCGCLLDNNFAKLQ